MRAIVCHRYDDPEKLQIRDIPVPEPGKDEVLVKIHATAINDYDWAQVRGKPFSYRLLFGIRRPKHPVPGMELSGTVEGLGDKVTSFKLGDQVYGDISAYGMGTFAEYISINHKALTLKPPNMPFESAAALPHAAMLATQGLIDIGKIADGMKILINGAGGGVGTLGLQLARLYDTEVTGVDTGEKLNMMRSLGFDHVIDYKSTDFTLQGKRYHLILDAKTNRPPTAYAKALFEDGRYVTVGGELNRLLQLLVYRAMGNRRFHLVALNPNKDLDLINKYFEEGKIKPIIDGPYQFQEIPKLIRYFGEGRHQGKVVIKLI